MTGNSPKTRFVPVAILIACAATNSYADPQADPKALKPAATKAATLTPDRKDAVRIIAQVDVPIALPLYLPPSRSQVSVRSSAATRGTGTPQNPTIAAIDL